MIEDDPILDAAEDVVEGWAAKFPPDRFIDVDGTPQNALLKVKPYELVEFVAGILRGKAEENVVPGDRVEHLTGRTGTARDFTDKDGIVVVHWDGNGPDHVSQVPRAHLKRMI